MEKPLTLAIGDVVKLHSSNKETVVTDVSFNALFGKCKYALSGTAWYDDTEFTFVRRADKESMAKVADYFSNDATD